MDRRLLRCVLPGGGQDPLHLCSSRCQPLQDDAGCQDPAVGAVHAPQLVGEECQQVDGEDIAKKSNYLVRILFM